MSDEFTPGSIVADKFRIERVLGQGGMGVVVLATHLQLDQRVALKFLLPNALRQPASAARFAREARAAAKIRSEHVARVIDVGTLDSGAPYIVMEYLEGRDLADSVVKQGAPAIAQAVAYILQACEALAEAHAGIVQENMIRKAGQDAAQINRAAPPNPEEAPPSGGAVPSATSMVSSLAANMT